MGTRATHSTKQDLKQAKAGKSARAAKPAEANALDLLREDHHKVEKLFTAFAKMREKGEPGDKAGLVQQACEELLAHAAVEEEIFYPAVRKAIREEDMMNEARVEHAEAKNLIGQIQAMDPMDEMYDAKVTVLGEYVHHHIKEEQDEMFPKVLKAKLDLDLLGSQILKRKEALMAGKPREA